MHAPHTRITRTALSLRTCTDLTALRGRLLTASAILLLRPAQAHLSHQTKHPGQSCNHADLGMLCASALWVQPL